MKFLVYIFLFLFVKVSFAQKDFADTTWFDKDWKYSEKSNASFYRVYQKKDKGFLVFDKFLNGKNQMIAEASSVKPDLVSNGYSVYFNENGSKDKRGYCKDDERVGIWTSYFDNEKDSSVYEYLSNQPVRYIRKSVLQKAEIFTVVEYMPEYPGGVNEMFKFIQSTVHYPINAQEKSLGGKVFLKFVVDSTGKIAEVNVIKSTGVEELDQEAVRVVRAMPKWKPGSQNGRNVNVFFNLPLNFSLPTPYFIFNVNNTDINYNKAKELVINDKLNEALEIYQKINGDTEVWYNLGVIYYLKKDKKESKSYFDKVIANVSDEKNTYLVQSKAFRIKI